MQDFREISTRIKKNNEIYDIKISEPRHLADVLRIMRENFHHEETMFKSLCSNVTITENEKRQIDEYLDGSVIAAFEASPCFVAVHEKTLEVVGVNITALSINPKIGNKTDGLETIFSSKNCTSSLVKKYIEYLSRMNEEARLFDVFPDARAMWEFYAIAIDKNHRKLGLASDLMNFGIAMAKKANVSVVFGVFTSIYSRKSAERAGMRSLMEFDLSKYTEENGSHVFKNIDPHNIATVMILEI